jgi:glycosyltransferase involved in cell wall biosynthesis
MRPSRTKLMSPLVTFVVPCYKLAHYLGACLDSLLSQSFARLEIIVMDDSSPDHTASIAGVYRDPRLRYIRNERNLGHLRNYNRGISLAAGKYLWLISADDCLLGPHALARYVEMMERDDRLAFVFSPAMGIGAAGEAQGIVSWTRPFAGSRSLSGRRFLATLVDGNCVAAPSVLARRDCYEAVGGFPLDLPHAGDWYLWCAFAFIGDVAYIDEPLSCYRAHQASMSSAMRASRRDLVWEDQIRVRWRLKSMADRCGFAEIAAMCTEAIAVSYAMRLAELTPCLSLPEADELLDRELGVRAAPGERAGIKSRIFAHLADHYFGHERGARAEQFYRGALRHGHWRLDCAVKLALLKMGPVGVRIRRFAAGARRLRAPAAVRDE